MGLQGNFALIPIDREKSLGLLDKIVPHQIDQARVVFVKLKRKLMYTGAYIQDNVRPVLLMQAAKWLQEHGPLYKEHGIDLNPNWVQDTQENCPEQWAEIMLLENGEGMQICLLFEMTNL